MMKTKQLQRIFLNISKDVCRINPDDLADDFHSITDGSPEDTR